MNPVLDTLLESLHPMIPYETAQVLLLETPTRLFLAFEAPRIAGVGRLSGFTETLGFLERMVAHLSRAPDDKRGRLMAQPRIAH